MFIIVVSRGYGSEPGMFELDQAKALRDYGHKVIIISLDLRSVRRRRKLGFTKSCHEGIETYNFSFPLGRLPVQILLKIGQFGINKIYKKILQDHGKPDAIHAHFTLFAAIAAILKKKYLVRFVMTEHNDEIRTDKANILIGKEAYEFTDEVITVSSASAEKIKQHFNVNCSVIPNIVDVSIFKMSTEKKIGFTLVSVGMLEYRKGFDLLVNAFHQANLDKTVSLLIIGEGDERRYLEKRIEELMLTEQIKLLGLLPRKKIEEYLSTSSAFVLASRSESFGVVYIEAMATGLPVIATRCGGPEYFVNETNGLLVETDNIEELKRALIYMYQNVEKYDAKKISEQTKELFSPETIAKKLTEIYKNKAICA